MNNRDWLRRLRWGMPALAIVALLFSLVVMRPSPQARAQAPTGTATFTPTPVTPTETGTSTPTGTPVTPTETGTSTPTGTPVTPTETATSTPTGTPVTPTETATSTPTGTPTGTPTSTPTGTPTSTPTITPTSTPVSSCPLGARDNLRTDIIGGGMGSNTAHKNVLKLTVPNWQSVVALYGQLAGKQEGTARYVRFIYPNNTYEQVNVITSPAYRTSAVFWYGAELDPAAHIRGRWFLNASGTNKHIPRAFILYPTYETSGYYINVFETFDDSSQNQVYHDAANGWTPAQQQVIPIPAPLLTVDMTVEVAVVDNDRDNRPFRLTISAGAASQTVTVNGPTNGDQLNLVQVTLHNVPAGTNQIVLDLVSPAPNGDSVAMLGMTGHYGCNP